MLRPGNGSFGRPKAVARPAPAPIMIRHRSSARAAVPEEMLFSPNTQEKAMTFRVNVNAPQNPYSRSVGDDPRHI